MRTSLRLLASAAAFALAATACGSESPSGSDATDGATDPVASESDEPDETPDAEGPLTVYSGRGEDLVGPVFDRFTEETGIELDVRYAGTAELASTILDEGANSPADVYLAQDAGALGALQDAGVFGDLDDELLSRVPEGFRSAEGQWVGVTGRARTIVYNTGKLQESDVPTSVFDLTEPEWQGRVGWAPTNGSFQAFVTAMRQLHGDDTTKQWIEDMIANGVQEYPKNTPIVDAVGRGEIDLGLVNHYYLFRFLAEDPEFPAAQIFPSEDVGGLINASGVGVLKSTDQPETARRLIEFLLSDEIQQYFATFQDEIEYPLVDGIAPDERLPALSELKPPAIDLSDLDDLQGTLDLLREAGALS